MDNCKKKIINLRLLTLRNGVKRGEYLRKSNIFKNFGKNVWWQLYKIPTQPRLVKIGNNVKIATEVLFIEHDVVSEMLNIKYNKREFKEYLGTIEIGDNSFIGARSIIMYNTKIGKNCIIGSGSIVTKDIPDNSIAVGNPAKVIGNVSRIEEKMRIYSEGLKGIDLHNDDIIDQIFWK